MNLPLFYRSIVPLNRETHRGFRLDGAPNFAFAATSHLIPAVVDEFPAACAELPILFVIDAEGASPVFLTGLAPGRDARVGADGTWSGSYVPAYLRRYPFILGEMAGSDPLICVDEQAEHVSTDDDAAPLFNPDGSDTARLLDSIRLVTDYAAAAKRTQAICKTLLELKLLQPITVQRTDAGASSALHGLLAVSEPALNTLADADFLRLRSEGVLGAIYTHLVSLRAIERLPS